jgi:hypothetical protein
LPDTQALDWVKVGRGSLAFLIGLMSSGKTAQARPIKRRKKTPAALEKIVQSVLVSANVPAYFSQQSWLFRPESFTENSVQYLAGAALG